MTGENSSRRAAGLQDRCRAFLPPCACRRRQDPLARTSHWAETPPTSAGSNARIKLPAQRHTGGQLLLHGAQHPGQAP